MSSGLKGDSGFIVAEQGFLPPEDGHEVFWARYGDNSAPPVLLLHGGPGSGMTDNLVALFESSQIKLIVADQRGSGRSLPFGELAGNNPWALVSDLERLRHLLGIDRWLVVGGSWGATLALAYAQAHAERVERLVLWGTWLFRPQDIDWHLYGARHFLPEAWSEFAAAVGYNEGDDLLQCFAEKVFDERLAVNGPAAAAWKNYERRRRSPGDWRYADLLPICDETTNMARIMIHYFLEFGRSGMLDLLGNLGRMHRVPGKVVHGRYDLITPFSGAYELCRAWRKGQLIDCGETGHTIDQVEIREAVINAIKAP